MSSLFGGKKKDPKEVMRENQRALKKTEREMERDANQMKRQEQQLVNDIKKAAKDGNMAMAKSLAKQLVRVREHQQRTMIMKAQVKGVGASMSVAASQGKMVESMGKVGVAMGAMNEQMDPKALAKVLSDFTQESEKMDAKQEIMDDCLDGIFDDDELEDEADDVTAQVLAEIGLDTAGRMAAVPVGKGKVAVQETEASAEEEDALAARLAALRS
mmetsp:Transcript_39839/g.78039  ORF Transcript_39839/g.78039 Transcript_39839/m.78039 type:complete len:215 (+) Transcript_39839:113-757(+)|eukprot:CAMPEP_0173392754 /NCGR_PEP_ID=MMETSP1356-20130122/21003_1 /TAXON_ID=77927 ORGANISM="Hemiselmis virescens, Strain PCC157" /NCGR_SAMPLE_ID=MMETSP1356 /ASSEMBLY_ACC=CAM_ASM_000847 /LENGTH=214 /DNA_ID=CAMNT_0014350643 /DNA_START=109 /DNA_END=753 /DNA_ORIENTATION=-